MAAEADLSNRFASAPIDAMRVYDDIFVPGLFIPWGKVLLDEVGLAPGEHVLDVACGPGTVTRLAAERVGANGRVVGADISPSMLAIARAKPAPTGATIEYVETGAAPLAIGTAEFDAVVCQQGLQFFPDRAAALLEMRRALKPGGRVAVAVWTAIDQQPSFAGLAHAVADVLGPDTAARYANGPWGHSSLDVLANEVEAAGFTDVRAERRALDVVFEGDGARYSETLAAAGIADEVAALSEDDRALLKQAAARHLLPLVSDGRLHSASASNIVVARA
jgi:ubiquinone/menaquinone biosynthesis C-methylase UbiE